MQERILVLKSKKQARKNHTTQNVALCAPVIDIDIDIDMSCSFLLVV